MVMNEEQAKQEINNLYSEIATISEQISKLEKEREAKRDKIIELKCDFDLD